MSRQHLHGVVGIHWRHFVDESRERSFYAKMSSVVSTQCKQLVLRDVTIGGWVYYYLSREYCLRLLSWCSSIDGQWPGTVVLGRRLSVHLRSQSAPILLIRLIDVCCPTYRARQLYKNISMLFLFPVKDGKASLQYLVHHVTVSLQQSKITLQNNCINNTSITQPTLSFYFWLKM